MSKKEKYSHVRQLSNEQEIGVRMSFVSSEGRRKERGFLRRRRISGFQFSVKKE